MTSKTYFVSWDRVYSNSLEIEKQLVEKDLDYLVYNNSSVDVDSPKWLRVDKFYYLGHLYHAMKDFQKTNHSVFIMNAGDGTYSAWAELTTKVENLFDIDPDCWAFAPNFSDAESFSWNGSKIQDSTKYQGLVLSTHTNGIWVALARPLVDMVLDFYHWMFENEFFDKNFKLVNSGWGIDSVFCAIAIYNNKAVYRDWGVTVGHTSEVSYDHTKAFGEMWMIIEKSVDYFGELGYDKEKMSSIYRVMYEKVNSKRPLSLREIYINAGDGFVA